MAIKYRMSAQFTEGKRYTFYILHPLQRIESFRANFLKHLKKSLILNNFTESRFTDKTVNMSELSLPFEWVYHTEDLEDILGGESCIPLELVMIINEYW